MKGLEQLSTLRSLACALAQSALAKRLAKGAFWSLAGTLFPRGLTLVSTVITARLLDKVGFGELAMVQSTVGMLQTFATFSLGITATKYVAAYRATDPPRAGRIIAAAEAFACITGGVFAAALMAGSSWVAVRSLAAPQLAPVLRIASLLLFFTALGGAQVGALSGFEAFKEMARVNLGVALLGAPLLIVGTYYAGVQGAVLASVVTAAVNWVANHALVRRIAGRQGIPIRFARCWTETRVLYQFSLPAVLSGAVASPATWVANALLCNQPRGYAELGVYNAIMRIKQLPESVATTLLLPVLPMLSEKYALGQSHAYGRILSGAFGISLVVTGPIAFLFAAIPQLCLAPYGASFQHGSAAVVWLMLHSVLIALFSPMASVLASMERMWFGAAFNLSWGLLYVAVSFALIPGYGASGLAAALAITHLVTSLPCLAYIYRYEPRFIGNARLGSSTAVALVLYAGVAAAGAWGSTFLAACVAILAAAGCCIMAARSVVHGRAPEPDDVPRR